MVMGDIGVDGGLALALVHQEHLGVCLRIFWLRQMRFVNVSMLYLCSAGSIAWGIGSRLMGLGLFVLICVFTD
jgi:hypothetical protein